MYLSIFDFALKDVAGKSIGQVDWTKDIERYNKLDNAKKKWLDIRVME